MTTDAPQDKIVELDVLASRVREARNAGRTVVHCHGVFDLLHIGHMRYFQRARELGDLLIVTVTPDRFVDKGAFRPAFPNDLRLEAIAALSVVDLVALNAWPTAEETLRTVRPDVYVKGAEFRTIGADPTGKMEREREVAAEVGCRIDFVDDIVFSSSQLINLHLQSYPENVAEYLSSLRPRWSAADVAELLPRMAELSVLVVGECVLETTVDAELLGLEGADGSPRVRELGSAQVLTGASALTRCLATIAGSTSLLTLADAGGLRDQTPADVELHCRPPSTGSAPRRKRWRDAADGRVWLTTREAQEPTAEDFDWLVQRLAELAPTVDVVILANQGCGLITPRVFDAARSGSSYLAHLQDGEPSPDFASQEVQLALLLHVDRKHLASRATTMGALERNGNVVLRRGDRDFEAPSFADRGNHEHGAEVFAAACCLADAAGAEPELTALVAQAARHLAATGDPAPSRQRLQKQLTSMLK